MNERFAEIRARFDAASDPRPAAGDEIDFIDNALEDVGHPLDLINRVHAAIGEHRTSQGPAATVPVWAIQEALDGGEG